LDWTSELVGDEALLRHTSRHEREGGGGADAEAGDLGCGVSHLCRGRRAVAIACR
jgi:hypothetical protein